MFRLFARNLDLAAPAMLMIRRLTYSLKPLIIAILGSVHYIRYALEKVVLMRDVRDRYTRL